MARGSKLEKAKQKAIEAALEQHGAEINPATDLCLCGGEIMVYIPHGEDGGKRLASVGVKAG